MISIEQIKAARLFLHIDQAELALLAEVSLPTVQRIENPKFGPERSSVRIVQSIKKSLEDAGIEFIAPQDGKGEGVRLTSALGTKQALMM